MQNAKVESLGLHVEQIENEMKKLKGELEEVTLRGNHNLNENYQMKLKNQDLQEQVGTLTSQQVNNVPVIAIAKSETHIAIAKSETEGLRII